MHCAIITFQLPSCTIASNLSSDAHGTSVPVTGSTAL